MLTPGLLIPSVDAPSLTVETALRFHLDEDRIREFLMGENLYGDPSLALRELYQNALDACRLATARRAFLRLPPRASSPTTPDIELEQGIDAEGRPYIDCVDRGAGMAREELALAFCQAGVRASDLTDRAAEVSDFASASPPIELWLNSRFGIGVMSYFMLAEAVTVTTARLNRDGSIGTLLSMHISDPAAEFDVVDRGPAEANGTRIRLWLKSGVSVSAVSTLRSLVVVCPLHLRVTDERGFEHRWMPGELNLASDELNIPDADSVSVAVPGLLWWIDGQGAVLADGIWAARRKWGMVLNLEGRQAPPLTADRRTITELDENIIEQIALGSVTQAVEQSWHIVGDEDWLAWIAAAHPRVADAIIERASLRGDRSLSLHGVEVDVSVAGFMPGDQAHDINETPSNVLRWRLTRLAAAGQYPGLDIPAAQFSIEPARPSDAVLIEILSPELSPDKPAESGRWPQTALLYEAQARLRYPLSEVVARARVLGFPVAEDADTLSESNDVVRTALSFAPRHAEDGRFRPIGAFDIVRTCWQLSTPAAAVLAALDERRIEVADSARLLESTLPSSDELITASTALNGIAPWLSISEAIGLDHVALAAHAVSRPAGEIVDALKRLGFISLPVLDLTAAELTHDDLRMLSRDLDGFAPFLRSDRAAKLSHLSRASRELGRPEAELRQQFLQFGVTFTKKGEPEPGRVLTKKEVFRRLGLDTTHRKNVTRRKLRLMSCDGDAESPWLDPSQPIPAWYLASLALHGHSIDRVIADFHWLGYEIEDPRAAALAPTPWAPLSPQQNLKAARSR